MQIGLLIAAGIVFVAAFVLRSTKPESGAAAWAAFGVGVALGAAAFVVPSLSTSSADVKLTIVNPKDGSSVKAGRVPLEVKVDGGDIASSAADQGGHVHVYVDGQLVNMPFGTQSNVSIPSGKHEITVEYVDAQHVSLNPAIKATVEVTAK